MKKFTVKEIEMLTLDWCFSDDCEESENTREMIASGEYAPYTFYQDGSLYGRDGGYGVTLSEGGKLMSDYDFDSYYQEFGRPCSLEEV